MSGEQMDVEKYIPYIYICAMNENENSQKSLSV